jgi:transposase
MGRYPTYGPNHPLYIQIKEYHLIQLIMKGYFLSEIANEFKVSIKTISRRIYDLWHGKGINNISDARRKYGGFELYKNRMDNKIKNSHHMNRIMQYYPIFLKKYQYNKFLENELSADEIDQIVLPMLIYVGHRAAEIGLKVGLLDSKWMAKRFQEILNMNFLEARDEYFFKQRLVYLLKKGLNSTQIVSYFNKVVKKPFRQTRIGIYNAMRRIWKIQYDEFTERAKIEGKWNKIMSPFDYNRFQFRHFYRYLKRIYHLYPKINGELAELIIESELSTKEIDKEFLIYLIQLNYSLEEIAKKYNSNYDIFRKWLKVVLGMNYNSAKDEYFWKPRILSLAKKYDPIHIAAKIAEGFNIPEPTVRGAIKRIWKCELEKLGSIRALLEYLKEN